jgi:putative transposase
MPKNELNLTNGMEVSFRGDVYQIRSSLSLTSFLLKHTVSGEEKVADLKDISPVNTVNDAQQESQSAVGVRLSSEQWQQAKRREAVIRPLAELLTVPTVKATQAAKELNLSVRHVYTLISRYRDSGGLLTSLVPTVPYC